MSPEHLRSVCSRLPRFSPVSQRVEELQQIWKEREAIDRARGTWVFPRDTSRYAEHDWDEYRESFASIWAGYEFETEHPGRISIDLPPDYKESMASLLEHHRHELHFIESISRRVDELKEKYAKK
jgi:hypothetical protein